MRDRWSSTTLFIFAAVGSAVGLGNIWRFPYLAGKYGGGSFLIPYLICLIVIGIPLLLMEFAIGQKLQKGAIDAFKTVNHRLRGIGFASIFSGFVVVVYYAAVMAWTIVYLVQSFSPQLPWAGQAKDYFFGNVLQLSDGIGAIGGINWVVFAGLAVAWILIYFSVWKGVKSAEKVVAITMPLPMILLVILFFRAITLEGALTGILAYITPNFSALLDTQIWIDAASQIFFTLSLAFGIMIAYASYNEKEDIRKTGYVTALSNSLISIFSGFVVFAVLGYMATQTGALVSDLSTSGPGLAFVVFPEALSLMPWANFFAVLFFLTLLSLGIDSAFSLVEAVNTTIFDRSNGTSKSVIAFLVCFVAFLLGILFTTNAGLYFLDVIDHYVVNTGLILVGLLQVLAIGWIYGADKLRAYINATSKGRLGKWWTYSIKYVIPIILTVLLFIQIKTDIMVPYEGYPMWAQALGAATVLVPLVVVAVLALVPVDTKAKL